MESFLPILNAIDSFLWGAPLIVLLVGTGILLPVRLSLIQVVRLPQALRLILRAKSRGLGDISSFKALCVALAATIGTGNIVGVATAVKVGGPGAIFWMWVTAILGMPIMFGEAVLAQMFRVRNEDGTTFRGGPAYYMRRGLNARVLPILFSVSVILGNGVVYCMVQSNSIAGSFSGQAALPPLGVGAVLVILTALVIFGGIKRLSTVASYVVPFMAFAYIILALIVLVTGASIIICSGAKRRWVVVTIACIVLFATVVVVTSMTPGLPHLLKPYQLNRLIVFVDSSVDPSGNGYNLQQAKIAVGSGGLLGKGIGHASQAGSGFLPEAHTDFVFAFLAEEFGFIGSALLLGLFAILIFSTITLAQRVEAPFGKLVLVGIATMWSFQLLQNVGMCIGIMPITGIPLPFISYGSSSMLTQLMAVGMVQSVWNHIPKTA